MALGPLANIPDLFPKSTLEDSKGFETVHHELEYLPPSHGSGWRTSILRYYTVTYSYDAILKPKSQHMAEDEQESNGSEEIEVEVHALAYTPPTRSIKLAYKYCSKSHSDILLGLRVDRDVAGR
jgi:hypothetical protein